MPLWQIDIYPAEGFADRDGERTAQQIAELGLGDVTVSFARGYLVQGDLDDEAANRLANTLLSDSVTERTIVAKVGDDSLCEPPTTTRRWCM